MECIACETEMTEIKELSRGMGNQRFLKCPVCGLICLVSGDTITQSWPPVVGQKGGLKCVSAHIPTSTIA